MKKFATTVVMLICMSSITTLFAQWRYGEYEIAPGLTLTVHRDGYIIDYRPPKFTEVIEETEHGNFSRIEFVDDPNFMEMRTNGHPTLPIKSLNLQLPFESYDYHTPIVYKPQDTLYKYEYREYQLAHPYMPAQNVIESDEYISFQKDESVYGSDEWYGYVPGGVKVSMPDGENCDIIISSINGQHVLSTDNVTNGSSIDTSTLAGGIYIVNATKPDGSNVKTKIIVKH